MPSLVEGTREGRHAARRTAVEMGHAAQAVAIAGGAGDNAASACGMGTVGAGACFRLARHIGRACLPPTPPTCPTRKARCTRSAMRLPNTWHQMGVILSATDSLNWLSEHHRQRRPSELTAELGDTLKAPTGVSFLPYLSGERTPYNDAAIRGSFTGLGHEFGPRRADPGGARRRRLRLPRQSRGFGQGRHDARRG